MTIGPYLLGSIGRLSVVGVLALGGCSAADYSNGIQGFSSAVTAAANLGTPLQTAAQQAAQDRLARALPTIDPNTVTLAAACNADAANYKAGSCAVMLGSSAAGYVGTPPELTSLSNYAAALSKVVADQTCADLQTDAKGLAGVAADLATAEGSSGAAAGPISQIVSTAGCGAINAEQLRILKASTSAADPFVQKLVPKIADVYNQYYLDAVNDAQGQAMSDVAGYHNAIAAYQKSKAAADLTKAQASLSQAVTISAAIDKMKANPPAPTVQKIATLHQNLTADLQAPKVDLARVFSDSQTFVAQAQTLETAAQSLSSALAPPPPAKPSH